MVRGAVERLVEEAERDGDAFLTLWQEKGARVGLAARRGCCELWLEAHLPPGPAEVLGILSTLGYVVRRDRIGLRASKKVDREEAAAEAAVVIGALRKLIHLGRLAP